MAFRLNIDKPYKINGHIGRIIDQDENSVLFSTPHGTTIEIQKIKEDSEEYTKLHETEKNAKRLGMIYGKIYKNAERGHSGVDSKKSKKVNK